MQGVLYAIFVCGFLESCLGSYNYSSYFDAAASFAWNEFWDYSKGSWNSDAQCLNSYSAPSAWDQAVAGKAIADTYDVDKINRVVKNMKNYLNDDNWFSSSTAKDNDVYIDDNAQLLWVLVDSYKYAGNDDDLQLAIKLMNNIMSQAINGGGVRWKLDGDYIASISTAEAALAATRLYLVHNDENLLKFATNALNWLFYNLQDSDDGLIYDGLSYSSGKKNTGKLTYSVGAMISALASLNQETGNSEYYNRASTLVNAALNQNGPFYNSDGTWNNALRYSHLLFIGISDLLTVTSKSGDLGSYYQQLISELNLQASAIINNQQISNNNYVDNVKAFAADASNYCNGNPIASLIDTTSAAQIFFALSKF